MRFGSQPTKVGINAGTPYSAQYSSNANIGQNMRTQPQALNNLVEPSSGDDAAILWLSRLNSALEWRRSLRNGDSNWEKAANMYKGEHWRDRSSADGFSSDDPNDLITVNLTMSSILNMIPFLIFKNPEFACKPRTPQGNVSAELQQAMMNYEWLRNDMVVEVKRSLYDVLTVGHGIVKTGYTIELDEAATKRQGSVSYDQYIKKDTPFIKRICPFLFLFDPAASQHDLSSGRWCAEIFFQQRSEVVANTRYAASVRNKIKAGFYTPTSKSSKFSSTNAFKESGDGSSLNNLTWGENKTTTEFEDDLVILYEVWDKKFNKYFIFCDGVNEPLLEKPWPYDYLENEFPYVKLDYIPINDEPYGVGIPFMIQDQQWEINRLRTRQFQHGRRFARKYEVLDSVEPEEVSKLKTGADGTIIRVRAVDSVKPITDAPMSIDHQIIEGAIKGDVQELTGGDALLRGGQLPSRTTAGEVNTRTTIFRLKLDDRVDDTDRWILKIGRQVLKHIKANMVREKVIRVLGAQGEYWTSVNPMDIAAEVDVTMETVAAPKKDPVMDTQQRLQIFEIASRLMPLVQAGQLQVDFNELFKWVLESFGYKDAGRFFKPAMVPVTPLPYVPAPGVGGSPNANVIPFPQQNGNTSGVPGAGQPAQNQQDITKSFSGAASMFAA